MALCLVAGSALCQQEGRCWKQPRVWQVLVLTFFFLKKNTLSATSGDNNYETMVQALKGARISKWEMSEKCECDEYSKKGETWEPLQLIEGWKLILQFRDNWVLGKRLRGARRGTMKDKKKKKITLKEFISKLFGNWTYSVGSALNVWRRQQIWNIPGMVMR